MEVIADGEDRLDSRINRSHEYPKHGCEDAFDSKCHLVVPFGQDNNDCASQHHDAVNIDDGKANVAVVTAKKEALRVPERYPNRLVLRYMYLQKAKRRKGCIRRCAGYLSFLVCHESGTGINTQ